MVLEMPSENRQCQGRGNMGGQQLRFVPSYISMVGSDGGFPKRLSCLTT